MPLLHLLCLACLLQSAHSLKCHQQCSGITNGTCSGEVCVIRFRGSTVVAQGCTFGGTYDAMRGHCVRREKYDECYCSENDMCNTISIFNISKIMTLQPYQCFGGTPNQCTGSTCSMTFGTQEKYFCQNTTESVRLRANSDSYIEADVSPSGPNSGDAVIINGTTKIARGSCYLENCWKPEYTAQVRAVMTKNVSTWCYAGATEKACKGDYCYITRVKFNETSESFTRGCQIMYDAVIPNSALMSVFGMDHFIDTTTVHCKDDNCNENFDRAWTAIGKPYAPYISSSNVQTLVLVITLPSLLH